MQRAQSPTHRYADALRENAPGLFSSREADDAPHIEQDSVQSAQARWEGLKGGLLDLLQVSHDLPGLRETDVIGLRQVELVRRGARVTG